jgi:hypothetical protein
MGGKFVFFGRWAGNENERLRPDRNEKQRPTVTGRCFGNFRVVWKGHMVVALSRRHAVSVAVEAKNMA